MSAAATTIARRVPAEWASRLRVPRDLERPLRVIAFAALATYVGAAWVGMVVGASAGRTTLVIAFAVGAAAAMSLLVDRRLPRPVLHLLAAAVVFLSVALGAIALGVPVRLVMPWHWGELAGNLGTGFAGLWNVDYPYTGSGEWTRLVLLLGLPAMLGVSVALAFWPTRASRPRLRTSGLIVLLIGYGVAMAVAPPGDPLLHGLWLLLLAAAWLWLPGSDLRRALLGGALVVGCGLVALPMAAALDGGHPWVDYRHWGATHEAGRTESFSWDQAYGPLTWPRSGGRMLTVHSDAPYYWRAAVLDEFDGLSWVQANTTGTAALQLPAGARSHESRLNQSWIHDVTVTVDGLKSDLAVAPGTPLAPPRIQGLTVLERGLVLPSDDTLEDGDSYTVRSYIPDPTPGQMRRAPARYPATLARDTEVGLPSGRTIDVPFWGAPGAGATDSALAGSGYGGVYDLARRITAGTSTEYGAVKAIESYLGKHYVYSEFAPIDRLALRTFLLRVHHGYCQHFSGAMALMLRMLGIPARVAAGFSPGRQNSDGDWVVTDFDSHAWVEAYFSGIGWVTFDPTPPGAPAGSRTSGLGPPTAAPASQESDLKGSRRRKTNGTAGSGSIQGAGAGGSRVLFLTPLAWLGILGLMVVGGGALAARRRLPRNGGGPDAELREIEAALTRVRSWNLRGSTLLGLERRLREEAGAGAAAYLARLRAMRYEPGSHRPPTPRERRIMRSQLAAGLGMGARFRALAAIPPRRLHANRRSGSSPDPQGGPAS
jgi:protein-glutamine gamma-glutamyltransferase